MLNREEYNVAFKTNLSQEEFDEIMGKPITDLSEVEELSIADRKGNVWRFLPKANAIPKEWIKNIINANIYLWEQNKERMFVDRGVAEVVNYSITAQILSELIDRWEKENGK